MRKYSAFLLALALLLSLAGCGGTEVGLFRTLEVIGVRQYGVICRKDDRLAPKIDEAMEELAATGVLSTLSSRWLGRDAITLKGALRPTPSPTPSPSPTPEAGEALSADGEAAEPAATAVPTETPAPEERPRTLIVGVEADYNPMAFEENGTLKGMSIEIAMYLGQSLGWGVVFQPISPNEVGTQLSSGNIDCALGFDPNAVNPEKYTVGVSYMESNIVLAVRRDSEIRALRDIRGQRVGTIDDPVLTGAIQANEKITKNISGATVYLSPRRCLSALDNGWCAAVAMDEIMLEHSNF